MIGTALLGVVTAVLIGTAGPAGADPLESAGGILQAGLEEGVGAGFPGMIGLIRDGDSVRYAQAGVGDLVTRFPADPATRFRIGSVTKTFTATVVLQLVGEGRLTLDDTVAHWLPGAVRANGNAGERISIRQLLNHSSGLPEYADIFVNAAQYVADMDPFQRWTPQSLVDSATTRPPRFPPGTGYFYANTNYVLLGMVIEAVTGNEPATEVERRIIDPLGLRQTTFPNGPVLQGNWMHGYFLIRDVSYSSVSYHGAAGAMVSALDDLATFFRAQLNGRLLAPAQQEQLRTTIETGDESLRSGLGMHRFNSHCGPLWVHIGRVIGYATVVMADDTGSKEVVIVGNESHLLPAENSTVQFLAAERTFCAL